MNSISNGAAFELRRIIRDATQPRASVRWWVEKLYGGSWRPVSHYKYRENAETTAAELREEGWKVRIVEVTTTERRRIMPVPKRRKAR